MLKWLIGAGLSLSAIPVIVAWGMGGTQSLRAQFVREAGQRARASAGPGLLVTEADLVTLPSPVRRYVRATGAVGQARPRAYRLTFTGRIRGGPEEPWMPFTAEQFSSVDEPLRLFYMRASRGGVPVAVFHRYVRGVASMQVKLAGLFTLVDAHGPEMNRSETVTVFNDMCLLAPGTLLDPRITWRARDDRSAEAAFTVGSQRISATLTFDEKGMLTNFESSDRFRASADGRSFTLLPFLTPVRVRGTFDGVVLAQNAAAQWRLSDGQLFTYAEFTLVSAALLGASADE
jgi:hypothetical protein